MADPTPPTHVGTPGKGLKAKLGPFSVGVWLALLLGAVLVGLYLRNKKAQTTSTSSTTPTALVYTGTGGGDQTGTDTTTTDAGTTETNEDWAQKAKTFLLAKGYDAGAVDSAINDYIGGATLNAQENALVSEAISGVGPTPIALPPSTGQTTTPDGSTAWSWTNPIPQTASFNVPTGSGGSFYTVQQGDTLASLAQKGYGASATDMGSIEHGADAIYNANAFQIADPKNLTAGTRLYIPVIPVEDFTNQGAKVPLGHGSNASNESKDWNIAQGVVPPTAAFFGSLSDLQK